MGILGPLVFAAGGVNLVPTAPKARQLLAFLMLNTNSMVRSSECIEELWGARPPKSAMSTLQTYILQIRRILKSAGRRNTQAVLVTKTPGYQLLGQEKLDRTAFTELADLGREAAATGQDRQASVLLSEALAMWRGPALADVRVGPMATAHVIELEECRMSVLDRRVEADLRLGRHRELLDELDMLIERHPTHENLRAQHMLALYRAGERSRALGDYHNVRRLLNDTLGIEPMPRLRRLYRAVLLNDPYLVAGTAGPELVSPDSTAVIPPPRTGEPA